MKKTFHSLLEFVADHGSLVLAAMLLMVLGTMGFIAITNGVSSGRSNHFDRRTIEYFRHHQGPGVIEEIAQDVTALGGPGCWLLITGVVGGYLVLQRRPYTAAWLVATVCSGAVVTIFLKGTIDRVPPGHPVNLTAENYYPSFPSGHSMMAAMVYLTLGVILAQLARGRWTQLYILLMSVVVVFLVGASRVYLCIHWPTDVLAGWAAGLVWALLCWVMTERLRQIHRSRKKMGAA
jgi:undecaprenyl-diphosphatase